MAASHVPLDSLNERRHRFDLATAVNDLLKVRPPHDLTPSESAAGIKTVDGRYAPLDPRRYGAGPTATDSQNTAAINNAIAVAVQDNGGTIPIDYAYDCDGQIVLFEGVRLIGRGGGVSGAAKPGLRYTGSTIQDFIITDSASEDENIELRGLRLLGGEFQVGKARYVLRFSQFHRGCVIDDCEIREGIGLIHITSGYYATITNNVFQRVNPSQATSGVDDTVWAEVFGSNSAPVFLQEMNGCDLSNNKFSWIVAEEDTGTTPERAIYISGTPVNAGIWTIESTGVDIGGFSPRVNKLVTNDGQVTFDVFYSEACDVTDFFFESRRDAVTHIGMCWVYDSAGSTMFHCASMGDINVGALQAYRVDYTRAWNTSSSGLGAGGDVIFGADCHWRSGERDTDAGVNADTNNVFDTFGTGNTLGAADGTFLRFHNQRQNFPRVVSGLTVTNSSDGDGDYIQVTSGVLLSERNVYVNQKFRTDSASSGNHSVQRLRVAASKFYRVHVGKAGNVFLEEAASAFTDPRGDWLSSFSTNGSAVISGLTANPRLSLRGNYTTGSTVCSGHRQTFAANDATPSVANGDHFVTANGSATTITALDDAQFVGHEVFIEIADANTTIDFTGTTLKGNSGADWTPGNGDAMRCKWNGTNWLCQILDATA
jgi:hypothetical protein